MQNAASDVAAASSIKAGDCEARTVEEDLIKSALNLAGRIFIRIRALNETASRPQGDESRKAALDLIGRLADAAHNLPSLIAQYGTNEWATEATLRSEISLCQDALRQASLRIG